ncbi:MAG: glycoside hydrolase family 11 protein [Dysgonamonadaceae bacterium]|jgi:endo-1,4-beta-xylanase|nr:glycoside hydrolase family 11 protein [Dysgonamonadaceae bacterium]
MKSLAKTLKTTSFVVLTALVACSPQIQKVIDPCAQTDKLDPTAPGVQVFTDNSGGNVPLAGSPFGYEMWTEGGNDNILMWFGPDQGGGAAFRTEWNMPHIYLGRVGYFWDEDKPYTEYKNIYCEFNYTRSGHGTAGGHSYIGIYGWTRDSLTEYYIVEDWFGNERQSDTVPIDTASIGPGATIVGSFTVDGAVYDIIVNTRIEEPSIDGRTTFNQIFSVRQTPRQCGTISVTEHFKKWKELELPLGDRMYDCKFLIEAGSGIGWFESSYLKFTQEDQPRSIIE